MRSTLHRRAGMTLIELVIGSAILVMVATALAALAATAERHHVLNSGRNDALQQAAVVIERIERNLRSAHASPDFPGFLVVDEVVNTWLLPEVLVIWRPTAAPADPDGLPRFDELIVYVPDPNTPEKLLEIRNAHDTRTVPAITESATWRSEMTSFRQSGTATELTSLLRVAELTWSEEVTVDVEDDSTTTSLLGSRFTTRIVKQERSARRGCVRFAVRRSPSATEWQSYKAGTTPWGELYWSQDLYGTRLGVARSWCSFELQFESGAETAGSTTATAASVLPFYGSAVVHFEMKR